MNSPIALFQAYGIEIELMIVENESLNIAPVADTLLTDAADKLVSDFEDGDITWSNELVSHVIEFKTTGPAPSLKNLEASFHRSQRRAAELLAKRGFRLMPTGMHPWMDPESETRLWPHDNNEIYSLYDKIFNCKGHGWSNLQSVHINLPFSNEQEFARLHSAIRLILPIIPVLSASTPFCDGKLSGSKDSRLMFYETNQQAVPIIAGDVIPEPVTGYADYRKKISDPIQIAIRPYDDQGLLEGDWLNSRGAIARIDRGTIEIRLLDTQECAHADLSLVRFIVATLKAIVNDDALLTKADQLETRSLRDIWRSCVRNAEEALVIDQTFISTFHSRPVPAATDPEWDMQKTSNNRIAANNIAPAPSSQLTALTAKSLWQVIFENFVRPKVSAVEANEYEELLRRPSLATRIETAAGRSPTRAHLKKIYLKLCECLDRNEIFKPESLVTEISNGPQFKSENSNRVSGAFPHL